MMKMKKGKGKESLEKTNLKGKPQEISDENMENVSGGIVTPNGKGGYNVRDNRNFRKVKQWGSKSDYNYYEAKTMDEVWNHDFDQGLRNTLRKDGW